MHTLKVLVVLALLGVAAAAGLVYSGAYNIGADEPHWPVTFAAIETLRDRSVAMRADGIDVPSDLDSAERIRRGAGNYDAMCAGCHLKPGIHSSEIRKGLYPQPPDLTQQTAGHEHAPADANRAAARQFWIIKHGIKMTGMPAWSKGGVDDATIWDMVALLQKLPGMSGDDYAALVAASEGHTHAVPAGHVDAPGTPPHGHGDRKSPDNHGHEH